MLRATVFLALSFCSSAFAGSRPTDPFQKYTISAPGIKATFIGYGATLTNLFVDDRNGKSQDVVVGYDEPKQYAVDAATNHSFFGPIVGCATR